MPNIPCFSAGGFFEGLWWLINPIRPAFFGYFLGRVALGRSFLRLPWTMKGCFLRIALKKMQKKNLMQSRVVIEKIQVEVLNKNKIRKKPTCSDLFRMFVCWVWNLNFQSKCEELEIPNQPKPKRSNQKENFAAYVDRVLFGGPTFHMGNGWVGPFHPVYVKAGENGLFLFLWVRFTIRFVRKWPRNSRNLHASIFTERYWNMMGRMENAFIIFAYLWPSMFRKEKKWKTCFSTQLKILFNLLSFLSRRGTWRMSPHLGYVVR